MWLADVLLPTSNVAGPLAGPLAVVATVSAAATVATVAWRAQHLRWIVRRLVELAPQVGATITADAGQVEIRFSPSLVSAQNSPAASEWMTLASRIGATETAGLAHIDIGAFLSSADRTRLGVGGRSVVRRR